MARSRPRRPTVETPPRPKHGRVPIALVLFLAAVCALKLAVMLQLQAHPLIEPEGGVDAAAYVRLARQVLGGDITLGPGLYYLSPLYIYFLSGVLAVTDSFTAVRVVQVMMGTAAVWCIFVTARLWFGSRAAWIAAALAALTGVFTFYEILILQASLDTFLTASALVCLAYALRPSEDVTNRRAATTLSVWPFRRAEFWAGAIFGVQTLNRPNVAIAAGGIVATLLIVRRWRTAVTLAGGLALAVAPIVARNVVVSHQFALSSSHGGLNFYIGNNADATGQYAEVAGVRGNVEGQSEDTRKVAEQAVGHPLTDAQVSGYFTTLALDWIRANPARAAVLFGRKLALVFNARHQWLDFSYPYYAYDVGTLLRFLFVGPWLLVPLGFAGIALGIAGWGGAPGWTRSGFVVWILFVPFYAVAVAVFFVAERYRLPILIPLCVCSGAAVDRLLQGFSRQQPDAIAAAAALAGTVITAWPFPLNNGRYDERLMLSKVLMNRHDYSGAAIELERALELQPANTVTEFNLGIAQIAAQRDSEGTAHLRHAVDANVPIPGARYVLANALLTTGDRDGAVALLRTYSPAADDTAESCLHVAQLAMNAGAPLAAERYLQRALQLRPGWPEALQLLRQIR